MYPSEIRFDIDELEELLYSRINNLINGLRSDLLPSDETVKESMIPKDFL